MVMLSIYDVFFAIGFGKVFRDFLLSDASQKKIRMAGSPVIGRNPSQYL